MGTASFLLGFFVALGGWTATKITKQIDELIEPPKITKNVDEKIVEGKVENKKEKENE